MNIVLLGCPGAGKGTQARAISGKPGLIHFSPGDVFRSEIGRKTPLGQEIEDYVSAGPLVPDWLILRLMKERFASEKRGLLFDGFPRTMEQAEELDTWLACAGCGTIYNTTTSKPLIENVCGNCAKAVTQRADDSATVVNQRMMVYRDQTEPLISYYRGSVDFMEIKAAQPQQAVTARILSLLKTVQRP